MGSLFGSSQGTQTVRYTGINLSTSTQGIPIPVGWGRNRSGSNIIWYNGFSSVVSKQSAGGKGGSGGASTYLYSTAVILAIGEGPINSVVRVWSNKDTTTLAALNLTAYLGTQAQTAPSFISSNYSAQAVSYSRTAYLFSSKYSLGSSPNLPSHNFEVSWHLDGSMAGYNDANPAEIIYDLLTNTVYGLGFPAASIDMPSLGLTPGTPPTAITSGAGYWVYCAATALLMSPMLNTLEQVTTILQRWAQLTNTMIFWTGDKLKFFAMGDTALTNGSWTFTPVNTVVYDLTLEDFITKSPGQSPITVTRKDPADIYNVVQIDCLDRNSYYNTATPSPWQDQTTIDLYGRSQSQSITAHEFCMPQAAVTAMALIGQREAWIRNKYKFTLGYNYLLLEYGDKLTLTDPTIGLNKQSVMIISITETEEQLLEIEAEEFNVGVGTVTSAISNASSGGNVSSRMIDPGNVNTPLIWFTPVDSLGASNPEIWLGASGGANWGGARIYISLDGGTTYAYLVTVWGGLEQGYITTAMTAGGTTVSVDLSSSLGVIQAGAVAADANALRTICLVESEIFSYGGSSLGGSANNYNLTGLVRGQFSTTGASHASNSRFTKMDRNFTIEYSLPTGYSSTTIYFKFCSFNTFENMLQDISSVTAYSIALPVYIGGVAAGAGGSGIAVGGGGEGAGGGNGG